MSANLYSTRFFEDRLAGSLESAWQIVPFLKEITGCQSVIDVGCGLGAWLSVFNQLGIHDSLGIDGTYVSQDKLLIPRDRFIAADLSNPPQINRRFDLAICLEVAEHLPPSEEEVFLDFLTRLSPIVAFSASIPFQDGTGHINEHWLEHWLEQFESRHYVPVDCVRPQFWNNPNVDWWYVQNTILYVSELELQSYAKIRAFRASIQTKPFSCVHPTLFLYKQSRLANIPVCDAWKTALSRTWKVIERRVLRRSSVINEP